MSLFKFEPIGVKVRGRELKCLVCDHHRFLKHEAQLNTTTGSFFGFDWANQSGNCYVCAKCGYIHWFLPQ